MREKLEDNNVYFLLQRWYHKYYKRYVETWKHYNDKYKFNNTSTKVYRESFFKQ